MRIVINNLPCRETKNKVGLSKFSLWLVKGVTKIFNSDTNLKWQKKGKTI